MTGLPKGVPTRPGASGGFPDLSLAFRRVSRTVSNLLAGVPDLSKGVPDLQEGVPTRPGPLGG